MLHACDKCSILTDSGIMYDNGTYVLGLPCALGGCDETRAYMAGHLKVQACTQHRLFFSGIIVIRIIIYMVEGDSTAIPFYWFTALEVLADY